MKTILRQPACHLVLLLVLTVCVYSFGLPGIFKLDDSLFILSNKYLQIETLDSASIKEAVFTNKRWPLYRATGMITFALQHVYDWMDPVDFKRINIAIHLLNGILVYCFSLLLLNFRHSGNSGIRQHEQIAALFVAAVWLLHPIQVSTVLYSFQRVTQLSALFVFAGLITYTSARIGMINKGTNPLYAICGILFFGFLAAVSKENGALLPLYALCLELTVFRFRAMSRKHSLVIAGFLLCTAVIPLLAATVYYTLPDVVERRFSHRSFSLPERLMTEARVLWFYLSLVFWPNIQRMALMHDDFVLSTALFTPWTTVFSILGVLILVYLPFKARDKYPLFSFGLLFWLASHYMESTFMSLELVYEHRNYIGLAGLAVFIYSLISAVISRSNKRILAGCIIIFLISLGTSLRAHDWSTAIRFYESEVRNHPNSARAGKALAIQYDRHLENNPQDIERIYPVIHQLLLSASRSNPDSVSPLVFLLRISDKYNKPINNEWYDEILKRVSAPPGYHEKVRGIQQLVTCQVKSCNLDNEIIENILTAAVASSYFGKGHIRELYAYQAMFYADAQNNLPKAIKSLESAINISPDRPYLYLNLAHLLHRDNKPALALRALENAKLMDNYKHYTSDIKNIRSTIIKSAQQSEHIK